MKYQPHPMTVMMNEIESRTETNKRNTLKVRTAYSTKFHKTIQKVVRKLCDALKNVQNSIKCHKMSHCS